MPYIIDYSLSSRIACQPIADTGASEGKVDLGFGPENESIFSPNPAYPNQCLSLTAHTLANHSKICRICI